VIEVKLVDSGKSEVSGEETEGKLHTPLVNRTVVRLVAKLFDLSLEMSKNTKTDSKVQVDLRSLIQAHAQKLQLSMNH
jgi:hypothetical protein